ncbi:hypothetical protein H5410_015781 [Solanum commersonii]|uniref:Uncharacterized protein n=1 Tax=Solanum commersonii TaxID=4109 RepID=A0A9J5ZUF7_SOLCO|nr:hypothetical protein H5410_015781 [Solanum commersonii]
MAHNASLLEEETMYASFDEDVRYLMNQGEGSQSRYQATNQGLWCPREENQGCIARDEVPKKVSNERVDDGVNPSALIQILVDEEMSKKQNFTSQKNYTTPVETCGSVHWQDSATSALRLASCDCSWRVANHAQVRLNGNVQYSLTLNWRFTCEPQVSIRETPM